MANKTIKDLLVAILIPTIVVLIIILIICLNRWAWNEFMPHMFGLKTVDYEQATALSFLLVTISGYRYSGKK